MTTRSLPLQENNRIAALDIMRGLALIGILVANSIHFQYGLFPTQSIHELYPFGLLDQAAEIFILLFAQASFYTLFSFLFGYGMALLKERTEAQQLAFAPIYWRRMFILLGIGYVHGLFIWDGDILFVYALSGFLFFFFLKLKDRGLLIWSLILLLLMASSAAVPGDDPDVTTYDDQLESYSLEEMAALSLGSYSDVVTFRRYADPLGLGGFGTIIMNITAMVSVVGMFLLGAFVARKKWLVHVDTHRSLIKKVWWVTLLAGFPCKLVYIVHESAQTEMIHMTIGGPLVAMFYAASIALLTTNEKSRLILRPFEYVGRLSLTNYLMQSLVFTTLFYGYGFGLFNQIGVFAGLILSFLFFFLQIMISRWWLNHFYLGPFEWAWRIGTYLCIPPLKRRELS